jgi:hypothetical protein
MYDLQDYYGIGTQGKPMSQAAINLYESARRQAKATLSPSEFKKWEDDYSVEIYEEGVMPEFTHRAVDETSFEAMLQDNDAKVKRSQRIRLQIQAAVDPDFRKESPQWRKLSPSIL